MQETEVLQRPRRSLGQRIRARWRRDLLFFLIALVVIAADQFTKSQVREHLLYGEVGWSFGPAQIIHFTNSGAAFGILQGQTLFLIMMSVFGLGAIAMYYFYPPMDHWIVRIALGLQLGGALGNFIDRVRLGEVTDWIDVGGFPTFNVADACISVSIVVVLGFFALQEVEQNRAKRAPKVQASDVRQPADD